MYAAMWEVEVDRDCAQRVSRGNSNCVVPRMLVHVFKLPSRDRTGLEEL